MLEFNWKTVWLAAARKQDQAQTAQTAAQQSQFWHNPGAQFTDLTAYEPFAVCGKCLRRFPMKQAIIVNDIKNAWRCLFCAKVHA